MGKFDRREFLYRAGWGAASVCVSGAGAASNKELEGSVRLAEGGKALAQILLPMTPAPAEQHAAEELQKYIFNMSGARLPVTDVESKGLNNIYLGASASTKGLDLSEAALGFDGYLLKAEGTDLILTGVKPYSCLYAVYDLLERHLGCGFFEDGDQVPKRTTIALRALNEVVKPRFEWRTYATFSDDFYSGMIWWDWDQYKRWVDWLAKKRLNRLEPNRLSEYCGITNLAAEKMGIHIPLTTWQQKQMAMMRRVFEYARQVGIRVSYLVTQYNQQGVQSVPGGYAYPDRRVLEEFIRRYEEKTGEKIPMLHYEWGGDRFPVMDPRHPVTRRFVTALVQAYQEALGGDDHTYALYLPSEGGWASADLEEMNRVTYSMLIGMAEAIKTGDAQATIYTRPPFPYAKTYEAQKRAVRDARLPVIADFWLNVPGRIHDFLLNDYYWNLPWSTGMCPHCGPENTPHGDLGLAIRNAQRVAADPRANHCIGFFICSETHRRNLLMVDLATELAWNPTGVMPGDYLQRWTLRRYGPDAAARLQSATDALAASVFSYYMYDSIRNIPLYRQWTGTYLPGLTPASVKRHMSYLPDLRLALETLLKEQDRLQESPLYRFDMVDYGRTYLGAIFNDRLARARKALRAKDKAGFEKNAREVEEVMGFLARYCSADPQFRLKRFDDWASRWPEIVPGSDNRETNWITVTALISRKNWRRLLDYCADDYAELIEHYYWPRVQLYLAKMRELVSADRDISGRLVSRGTDRDVPYRIGDFAPPKGKLAWSPYGVACEPELTAGDLDLAHQIIEAGTVSGKFDFYDGPMDGLVRELLARYPVPQDLREILGEPDVVGLEAKTTFLEGKPGDVVNGFRTPDVVEQVRVPKEVAYAVDVEKLSQEYNIARGPIATYRVQLNDFIKLKRLQDEKASLGDQNVAVFEFELLGRKYILRYDPGSTVAPAGLYIDPR